MIVPMQQSHIAQIAALEKRCFSDPWSEASVRSELSKGNTEIIAEMIAKKTGGTLLHVEPAKEYPKGYDDCINVAKKELAQDARPAIKPVNVNPEEFDEIYVGYPVWWG